MHGRHRSAHRVPSPPHHLLTGRPPGTALSAPARSPRRDTTRWLPGCRLSPSHRSIRQSGVVESQQRPTHVTGNRSLSANAAEPHRSRHHRIGRELHLSAEAAGRVLRQGGADPLSTAPLHGVSCSGLRAALWGHESPCKQRRGGLAHHARQGNEHVLGRGAIERWRPIHGADRR